jgi:hypothetical protein
LGHWPLFLKSSWKVGKFQVIENTLGSLNKLAVALSKTRLTAEPDIFSSISCAKTSLCPHFSAQPTTHPYIALQGLIEVTGTRFEWNDCSNIASVFGQQLFRLRKIGPALNFVLGGAIPSPMYHHVNSCDQMLLFLSNDLENHIALTISA